MPVPSNPQDLINIIREKLFNNTSGLIEEPDLREVLENIVKVLDAKFSMFSPNLTEEQFAKWNLILDYMANETKGVLSPTSPAPTEKGKYLLSSAGTYTNLGGLVATADKLNYAYFDGENWSLISSLIDIKYIVGVLSISDVAPTKQGLYLLSTVGTYTNLGGLVASENKLNYAYFDGENWSLTSVDSNTTTVYLDSIDSLRSLNGSFDGQNAILLGYTNKGDKNPVIYEFISGDIIPDNNGDIIATTNGNWILKNGAESVNAKDFGVKANGTTDDWLALQRAINYALKNKKNIQLPEGKIRITKTLQVGYGITPSGASTFHSLIMKGVKDSYKGETGYTGTIIFADFADRQAINVQAARKVEIENLTILGKLSSYIETNNLGSPAQNQTLDDKVITNWVDSSLSSPFGLLSRYAPYAGVTVDGYKGTKQSEYYPDIDYSNYVNSGVTVAQYGKNPSSIVTLKNVEIAGFAVGVCYSPSALDNNGDFCTIRDSRINRCIYGISFTNSQGRNMIVENTEVMQVHTAFTNNTHGLQIGTIDATWNNVYVGWCINIFNIQSGRARNIIINKMSGEGIYSLGKIDINLTETAGIIFNGMNLTLTGQNSKRGMPLEFLGGLTSAGIQPNITFNSCIFSQGFGWLFFAHNVVLNDCEVVQTNWLDIANLANSTPYKAVHNVYSGLIKTPTIQRLNKDSIRRQITYNLDNTSTLSGTYNNSSSNIASRNYLIPFYAQTIASAQKFSRISNVYEVVTTACNNITDATWIEGASSLKLTYTAPASQRNSSHHNQRGYGKGDIVIHSSGMIFFVEDFNSSTFLVTLRALNNYVLVSGVYKVNNAITFTASDNFTSQNARHYLTSNPVYVTSNSTNVLSNVVDATGAAPSDITVNDYVWFNRYEEIYFNEYNVVITAYDSTAKTITLPSGQNTRRNGEFKLGKITRIIS